MPIKTVSKAAWINRWEVVSETTGEKYIVGQKLDGSWGCSCKRWIFSKTPKPACKHIIKVQMVEQPDTSYTPTIDRDIPREAIMIPAMRLKPEPVIEQPTMYAQTRRRIVFED